MQIGLNFVTPLWTGGASRQANRVQNTGLLGSLRWWYEALVRGLGGYACDPTGDHRCLAEKGLCSACQVFGATGQAKAFRLSLEQTRMASQRPYGLTDDVVRSRRAGRDGQPARYYFPEGLLGQAGFSVLPRLPNDTATPNLLLSLLEFIRRYAALGAKTNLGYGLFEWITSPAELEQAPKLSQQVESRATARAGNNPLWPDLRRMFFATVQLPKPWSAVGFVDFKNDLRMAVRTSPVIQGDVPDPRDQDRLRHFLLGTVRENPNQASKIKMALLPGMQTLRVWGWVPEQLPGRLSRDVILDLLHGQIGALGKVEWREYASTRDTVGQFNAPVLYLDSLMQ